MPTQLTAQPQCDTEVKLQQSTEQGIQAAACDMPTREGDTAELAKLHDNTPGQQASAAAAVSHLNSLPSSVSIAACLPTRSNASSSAATKAL